MTSPYSDVVVDSAGRTYFSAGVQRYQELGYQEVTHLQARTTVPVSNLLIYDDALRLSVHSTAPRRQRGATESLINGPRTRIPNLDKRGIIET